MQTCLQTAARFRLRLVAALFHDMFALVVSNLHRSVEQAVHQSADFHLIDRPEQSSAPLRAPCLRSMLPHRIVHLLASESAGVPFEPVDWTWSRDSNQW